MRRSLNLRTALTAAAVLACCHTAIADPCGMVPPIYTGDGNPITRVGAQMTYVFHSDGVETIVLRPAFSGKVDQFGMLIPFPSVPAIRKVPDTIFSHVAAAIDPPEVVIDLRWRFQSDRASGFGSAPKKNRELEDRLKYKSRVRVVKQEAVGMYEVAVLDAGSAAALKKWMDEHGYRYPEGMDKTCEEYVDQGWCFVAVKTKVGQKEGAQPRPGQRQVNVNLPKGSTFDGAVQAMGFRFESEEVVVPMRLSAFNAGKLRNIVYLLTDKPSKIQSIPEEFVVRQVRGSQLLQNVTDPLPLRVIGGTVSDIPDFHKKGLDKRRDPTAKNGAARELFASDLLAASSKQLSHPHEESEKVLLRIGERLGLRGADVDRLNAAALATERQEITNKHSEALKNMTLTTIDGEFPREVIAKQNLHFRQFDMPARRNRAVDYDAKKKGPGGVQPGVRVVGSLDDAIAAEELLARRSTDENSTEGRSMTSKIALGLLALGGMGLILTRRKTGSAVSRMFTAAVLGVAMFCFVSALSAQGDVKQTKNPEIRELLAQLGVSEKADAAVAALVKLGGEAVPLLKREAIEGDDLSRRGWAMIALAEIGPQECDAFFLKIHADKKQPPLVRTWAAAARVSMTESTEGLIEKATLAKSFPALGRPIGMRLVEKLSDPDGGIAAEEILDVSLKVPQLQKALAPAIMALGAEKLTRVLTGASDQNIRRQAAAYLGALGNQGDKSVAKEVIKAYQFDPKAKQVAWSGGPLFLPGYRWEKDDARKLVGNLVAWHLWCDRHSKSSEQRQIHNNLASLGLSNTAGFQLPRTGNASTTQWLEVWGKAIGRAEMEKMLKAQGAEGDRKYAKVLKKLPEVE